MLDGTRKSILFRLLAFILIVPVFIVSLPPAAGARPGGWIKINNLNKMAKALEAALKLNTALRFADWAQAEWALAPIARLKCMGIIKGYEDNNFKPNTAVKQSEALAMIVRVFDMEEEAMDLALRFADLYSVLDSGKSNAVQKGNGHKFFVAEGHSLPFVPSTDRWALGYVLLAVEEGWVSLREIEPNKPASRAWIAMVMVRALGYEDQARSKMNAKLPFKDFQAIEAMKGYVAQALEIGLFQGYEDNTFRPNQPVTRAEMATILDRFIGDEIPVNAPYRVVGRVKSITGNTLTITTLANRNLTYIISKDALVLFGNVAGKLSDISVGDSVQVLSNGAGVALMITITNREHPDSVIEVVGEVISVGISTSGTSVTLKIAGQKDNPTYKVKNDCPVTYKSQELMPSEIALGDVVKAKVRDGEIVELTIISRENQAPDAAEVEGVISQITLTNSGLVVEVKTDKGRIYTVPLRSDCQVIYGTKLLDWSDLSLGDEVAMRVENQRCYRIHVLERAGTEGPYILGRVQGIVTTATSMKMKLMCVNGKEQTVTVSSNAEVVHGEAKLKLNQVRSGDTVRMQMKNQVCVKVYITARAKMENPDINGVIKEISYGSSQISVTIRDDNGKEFTYVLSDEASIWYGNKELTPDDLSQVTGWK